MQSSVHTDGLIDFWRSKDKEKYFELKHPIYNHINTRAVYSVFYNWYGNYIFFVDSNNTCFWIMAQHRSACDFFIADNRIYRMPNHCDPLDLRAFVNIDPSDIYYKDAEFRFFIGIAGYYHVIYEQLAYLYAINPSRPIAADSNIYTPICFEIEELRKDKVYFYPKVISAVLRDYSAKPYAIKEFSYMASCMYKESMSLKSATLEGDGEEYDLRIWISLVWVKRIPAVKTWLNQIDAICAFLNEIKKSFNKVLIYFDGLRTNDTDKELKYNEHVADMIKRIDIRTKGDFTIKSLDGVTIKTAIQYCSNADIAIAEGVSGSIIPALCCRKPTLQYGNPTYLHLASTANPSEECRLVRPEFVGLAPTNARSWEGEWNYFIPYSHIYNVFADMLEDLSARGKIKAKNLRLPRLEELPARLLVKKYEEEELGREVSIDDIARSFEKDYFFDSVNNLLARAKKTWPIGGIVKFYFDVRKVRREFKNKARLYAKLIRDEQGGQA